MNVKKFVVVSLLLSVMGFISADRIKSDALTEEFVRAYSLKLLSDKMCSKAWDDFLQGSDGQHFNQTYPKHKFFHPIDRVNGSVHPIECVNGFVHYSPAFKNYLHAQEVMINANEYHFYFDKMMWLLRGDTSDILSMYGFLALNFYNAAEIDSKPSQNAIKKLRKTVDTVEIMQTIVANQKTIEAIEASVYGDSANSVYGHDIVFG